jgi:hypothetical protein
MGKIFTSKLEEIMKAEELAFPSTAGFRPFHRYFDEESVKHPAN